ncbi:hypothetical protein J2T08_001878 [Neorhizobium galegae]|uniref:hypothetical protein n=1 Tax=Neorhizobium galegae TaxID=399 RepID=UPI0027802672|nr:hypothetical protein [Neorhizobium galegae]MDQ0133960.1 hypothetical protein [Neorhizobium galegae]
MSFKTVLAVVGTKEAASDISKAIELSAELVAAALSSFCGYIISGPGRHGRCASTMVRTVGSECDRIMRP